MLKTKLNNNSLMLLFLIIILQIPMLFIRINEPHTYRQTVNAAVSRNFVLESPNIFLPRLDDRQEFTGINAMGFPSYHYLVSFFYRFIPPSSDIPGKLVAFLMGFGAIFFSIRLFGLITDIKPEFYITAFFSLPIMFFYNVKYMPGTTGLFLMMAGLYYYYLYSENRSKKYLLLAFLGLTLGSLTRPFFIFLNLPLLIHFIKTLKEKKKFDLLNFTLGVCILIPFGLWYLYWLPYLRAEYTFPSLFFPGEPLSKTLEVLLSLDTWSSLLYIISQNFLNWILIPLYIYGLIQVPKLKRKLKDHTLLNTLIWLPVIEIPLLILVSGRHFDPHFYWLFALIPSFAFVVALALYQLWQLKPKLIITTLFLLPVLTAVGANHNYRTFPLYKDFLPIMDSVNNTTNRNELFAVEDLAQTSVTIHALGRRGWELNHGAFYDAQYMKELKEKGLKWVVLKENDQMIFHHIDVWLKRVGEE